MANLKASHGGTEMKLPRAQKGLRLQFQPYTFASDDGRAITVSPARYAKGKVIVRIARAPKKEGEFVMKRRADRLIEGKGIGGLWVHREGGYILSPSAAERFVQLYRSGWDAEFIRGALEPPSGLSPSLKARIDKLLGKK